MGSLEEPTPLGEGTSSSHQNQGRHTPPAMLNKNNIELADVSQWTLDGASHEELEMFEEQAIHMHKLAQAKLNRTASDTPNAAAAAAFSTPNVNAAAASTTSNAAPLPSQVLTKESAMKTEGESSVAASITPNYSPAPRRMHKMPAALQSPYVEVVRKVSFKCSRDVARVYEAVCSCPERRTRSNNRDEIIINYEFNHATLGDLVDPVKPGGKMKNTIAEIGIYVINGKKTRGAIKCVMALHVSEWQRSNERSEELKTT
ncbi:hypothetical protein PVAP13_7KG243610 [Panicum virgatum]|uniref:Uncharacterized protein n=1 Tax=Panicum virgatum TaxID=38727 RepID=A0A8T0QED4_PANVG|nr:hypothetical protein PVAP13_7KG243610 [Panicum virgatum]